ncbi:MAG: hypothetical protein RR418_04370, partial [Clostridia bacterium]
ALGKNNSGLTEKEQFIVKVYADQLAKQTGSDQEKQQKAAAATVAYIAMYNTMMTTSKLPNQLLQAIDGSGSISIMAVIEYYTPPKP